MAKKDNASKKQQTAKDQGAEQEVQSDSKGKKQVKDAQQDKSSAEKSQKQAQPASDKQTSDGSTTTDQGGSRTKEQFEKLLESNKQLYDSNKYLQDQYRSLQQQVQQRSEANQQFAPIQQAQPAQQPVSQPGQQVQRPQKQLNQTVQQAQKQQVDIRNFVQEDPETGERFIDDRKLQEHLDKLNQKATNAEKMVQNYIQTSEQREVERQNQEAFKAYPGLDPNSKDFNYGFHQQTRAVIYDSLINPQDYGGKSLRFKQAADFIQAQQVPSQEQPSVQEEDSEEKDVQDTKQQEAQEAQEIKEQASAAASGQQPAERTQKVDDGKLKQLQMATRKGDLSALAQRLASTEHTTTASEEAS